MGSRQDLRQVSDRASKKGKHAGSSRDSQTSSDEGEEDADDAEESVASSDDGDDLGSVSTFESDDQNRKEFLDEDQDNPLLATRHFHALMGTNLQEILETLGKEREEQTLEEERAISAGAARAKKSRGGGRHRRKLASKLSSSLADFLGAATGEFRGPGDVYRRFLISGLRKRGVAPPVSTVLGNGRRVHEDPGRSVAPNYLTVGPSPVELAVKSNKKARRSTVTSASYFQFESPAQRNNRKLALLHEIRI